MSNIIPTAYDGRMKSITRTDFGVIAGIAALYGLLTFGGITRWSIWFDEAFSAYLMRFDMGGIMHYTAADVHPPFYYLVLKLLDTIIRHIRPCASFVECYCHSGGNHRGVSVCEACVWSASCADECGAVGAFPC